MNSMAEYVASGPEIHPINHRKEARLLMLREAAQWACSQGMRWMDVYPRGYLQAALGIVVKRRSRKTELTFLDLFEMDS